MLFIVWKGASGEGGEIETLNWTKERDFSFPKIEETVKGHQVSFGGRNNCFLARGGQKERAVGQNNSAKRLID